MKLNSSGQDNGYVHGIPFSYDRRITGDIPAGRSSFSIKGDIPDPGLFFAKCVTDELRLDGMKVIPGNDANVAALGEMWKGGGNSEQLHSSNANPCQVTAFIECSNTAGAYQPLS